MQAGSICLGPSLGHTLTERLRTFWNQTVRSDSAGSGQPGRSEQVTGEGRRTQKTGDGTSRVQDVPGTEPLPELLLRGSVQPRRAPGDRCCRWRATGPRGNSAPPGRSCSIAACRAGGPRGETETAVGPSPGPETPRTKSAQTSEPARAPLPTVFSKPAVSEDAAQGRKWSSPSPSVSSPNPSNLTVTV